MAITIRKLNPEEAERFFPQGVATPIVEYIDALRELRPGDSAEASKGSLSSRAFKRRLTLAGKHLGLVIKYAREADGDIVRFQVREPKRGAEDPSAEAPRRRGRPRKTAASE